MSGWWGCALGRGGPHPLPEGKGIRLVLSHEGGYSLTYVPFCGFAVVEELSGNRSIAGDPFEDNSATAGGQEIQPHQQSVLDDAKSLVDVLRRLEGV